MAVAEQISEFDSKQSGLKVIGGVIAGTVMMAAAAFGVSGMQSGGGVAASGFTPSSANDEWSAPRVTSSTLSSSSVTGEDEVMAAARGVGGQTFISTRTATEAETMAVPRILSESGVSVPAGSMTDEQVFDAEQDFRLAHGVGSTSGRAASMTDEQVFETEQDFRLTNGIGR